MATVPVDDSLTTITPEIVNGWQFLLNSGSYCKDAVVRNDPQIECVRILSGSFISDNQGNKIYLPE